MNFNGENGIKVDLNKVEQLTPAAILEIQSKMIDGYDTQLEKQLFIEQNGTPDQAS
jgi:hypothetical protein